MNIEQTVTPLPIVLGIGYLAESLSSDKPPYGLLRSLIGICRAKSEIYFRGSIIIFIYFIKIIRGGEGILPKNKKINHASQRRIILCARSIN